MQQRRFVIPTFTIATVLVAVLLFGACAVPTPPPAPTLAPAPTLIPAPAQVVVPTTVPTPPPGVTAVPSPAAAPTPQPVAGDQPIYGGKVLIGTPEFGSFDPLHSLAGFHWATLGASSNLWGQLLRVNPEDRRTVEGDLVESWELLESGAEWRLQLREGVMDHGGEPFTAEDAFWSVVRVIERPNGVHANYQGCMRVFVNPVWDEEGNPLPDAGAEITGPMELTVRLQAPRGAFASCLVSGFQVVQPSRITKPLDTAAGGTYRDMDPANGEMIGYGPFKLESVTIDTVEKWTRNDDYFREGRPYLDGVEILIIPDKSTRIAAFKADRINMFQIFESISQRDVADLEQSGGVFPIVLAMGWRGMELNLMRPPLGPQDDAGAKSIRQAIQMAVNRQQVNSLSYDGVGHVALPYFIGWDWIRSEQDWYEALPGFDPDPQVKESLVAEAKQMMEAAGFGPDNLLDLVLIGGVRNDMEIMEQQLREIHIDVEVQIVDEASRDERGKNGDYDLFFESKGATFPDPDAFNTVTYEDWREGGFNYTGWNNPRWRALLDREVVQISNEDRAPLLREMADIFYEDAAFVGVVRPGLRPGYRDYFRGWVPPPHHASTYPLENVWFDQ